MEDLGLYFSSFLIGVSFVSVPYLVYQLGESLSTGVKVRGAIRLIELGEDPRKHRWDLDDARIDPIACRIAGRKKLEALCRRVYSV